MAVTVYRSSDASAPVLSGQAGAFLAIIHACLVTGYGIIGSAGWAREFLGTNLGVYRAASGNRFRFRIDDTGAQEARVVGYEVMTDVNTGTGPFPTAAQQSGGLYVRKSATANSTARPWVLIASDTGFMFFPDSGGTDWLTTPSVANTSGQMYFGDLTSFKPSDAFGTIIIAATTTGDGQGTFAKIGQQGVAAFAGTDVGHFLARNNAAVSGAVACSKSMALASNTVVQVMGTMTLTYPDPVTGGMLISPIYIHESGTGTALIRGRLPGVWGCMHNLPATHADTMTGSGDTAGKSFLLAAVIASSTIGRAALETSNTW